MVYVTKLDKNANKELNIRNLLSWLLILILGLGMTSYGVIASLFSLIDSVWCSLLMAFGAILFLFSLICIILIIKIGKNQNDSNLELSYDFRKKYVLLDRIKDGKVIESEKIIYEDIIKTKETKNYIYIYKTDKMVIPFYKSECKIEDLELIKNYLNNND